VSEQYIMEMIFKNLIPTSVERNDYPRWI